MKSSYNKHKSRLIYSLNLNSKKVALLLIVSIMLVSTTLVYNLTERSLRPLLTNLAVSEAKLYAIDLINKTSTETAKSNIDYSKLSVITKDENGNIVSIDKNTKIINEIKLKSSKKLVELLSNSNYNELSIPLGNITKSSLFSGRGPSIPIRVLISGTPKAEIDNRFESAGINQTKHKISMIISVEILIILPYEELKTTVSSESMLSETIILGKIPNVYIAK